MLHLKKTLEFLTLVLVFVSVVFITSCQKENAQTPLIDDQDMARAEQVLEDNDQDLENTEQMLRASQFFTHAFSKAIGAAEKARGLKDDELDIQVRGACDLPSIVPLNPFTFPKTITFDFGTGCTDFEGRNRSGKMILDVGKIWQPNAVIKATFDNFTQEKSKMHGYANLTNQYSAGAQNFIFTADNMAYTDELGRTTTYTTRQTLKQVEGMRSANSQDDVFEMTTTLTGTFANGKNVTLESTSPFKKANNCQWIQKGTGTMKTATSLSTLDFGNDTCDNDATITTNGVVRPIKL